MADTPLSNALARELAKSEKLTASFAGTVEGIFTRQIPSAARSGFSSLNRELESTLRKSTLNVDSFGKAVQKTFGGLLEGLAGSVGRSVLSEAVTAPLQNALVNPLAQGISSLFSGIFGGARADGGAVSPGRSYLVGEQGPETFVPSSAGTIVPGRTASAPTVNITITTPDARSFWQSKSQLQAAVASAVRAANR